MTIGWRTPGAWASGSTSISPALPASPAAGDRMVLFVGCKPFNATINQPTGWTRIGTQQTNGSTGSGIDTGSVTWSVFYRDWQTGDAAPAVSITSGNVSLGVIHGATKTAPAWDTTAAYFGSDTTSGTGYSITAAGSSGNITNGDGLIHGTVIAGNDATFGTPTLSSGHGSKPPCWPRAAAAAIRPPAGALTLPPAAAEALPPPAAEAPMQPAAEAPTQSPAEGFTRWP